MDKELPPEILIDIFSRLPAKSVGRCRSLAKPWRTLLSTPQFIKSHLSRKPHQETIFLISPSRSSYTLSKTGCPNFSIKHELGGNWSQFFGSCNGLVLLVDEEEEMFLVNPTTLEQLKISHSPVALKTDESFRMHGFGYDSNSDDYKIVTLSYYDTDNEHEPDCADTFVDVYSLKTGVWKRVDCSPYDHAVPYISSGVFVNGAIHWLASSRDSGYPSVIAAFDLAHEVFHELPPPNGVDVEKFVFNMLAVLGGCLCMVDSRSSMAQSDIWIMKEYGLAESWMKLNIPVDTVSWGDIKPLCFTGDDDDSELVLVTEAESVVVSNLEEGSLREMVIPGVEVKAIDGGTFVESLVSPASV